MIKKILTAAGVLHRRSRFLSPPSGTYAVYFDDVDRDGADPVSLPTGSRLPGVYHHDGRIELYESAPDDDTERALEDELDASGLHWTKEDRYWLQDVQRYQVLYDITYTSKTR
jgi:hypothetical protein